MTTLADSHQGEFPSKRFHVERARRPLPRTFLAFVAFGFAVLIAIALQDTIQSPAQQIRSELQAAASHVQTSAPVPRERLLAQLRRDFRDHDVTIAADAWPNIAVTFHHLDAATCREAAKSIDRLEGLVVVALDAHRDASDCRDANDLTWRILP